jgi:hypothetical protein
MAWARFGLGNPGDDLPIDQWQDDRTDYLLQRESLDAAGQDTWNSSTRSGDNLQANRPIDITALGAASTDPYGVAEANAGGPSPASDATDRSAPTTAVASPPLRYVKAAPGDSISRLIGTSDPDDVAQFQKLNGMDKRNSTIYSGRVYAIPNGLAGSSGHDPNGRGSGRSTSAAQPGRPSPTVDGAPSANSAASQPTVRTAVGRNGALQTAARGVELGLADTAGVVAGAFDVGMNVLRTAELGQRAMDPMDLANLPRGTSALNQVLSADAAMARYGLDRLSHPSRMVDDVKGAVHRTHVGLDPTLTPTTSGSDGTFKRYFDAGRNQGRLGADASLFLLGPTAEAGLDGAIPYETNVLKFRGQGFNQSQAEYLAQLYPRWGHHVAARRLGLPDWITENPVFQLKPGGVSRGDLYQLHFENDPKFFGTRFPRDVGGSWRGKTDLKLKKNGPVRQFWDGTPSSLKSVVGTGVAANDAAWNH